MRLTILAALAALAVVLVLLRWFMRGAPEKVARAIRWSVLAAAIAVLIYLAGTGRLHWLFALVASVLPFLRRLPRLLQYLPFMRGIMGHFRSASAAAGPSTGRQSSVTSKFLHVTLDHDSGGMDGVILAGRYQGQHLGTLNLAQLAELYTDYLAADADSAALLEAYLEQTHADEWHDHVRGGAAREPDTGTVTGAMSSAEALQVLGLEEGAGRDEIIAAHRRLLQRLHPDRGGSTYLAAKINQARDLLLSN